MNRYRGPNTGGPSKATASTVCQKCLKKDTYECKAVAQERPYVSRPSRTQQLLNPKLLPKLTSDVPQDLLRKKGIADEELKKKELERGRKRDRNYDDSEPDIERKRLRSASTHSSVSVATISTRASPSPPLSADRPKQQVLRSSVSNSERKRRRSSIASGDSYPSDQNQGSDRQLDRMGDRSTRRKFNEASPMARGRRRSRTRSRGRRQSPSSYNETPWSDAKFLRARSRSRSPHGRKNPSAADEKHVDNSRADNPLDSESARHQEHPPSRDGPNIMRRSRDRSFSSDSLGRRRYSDVDERYGTSSRDIGHYGGRGRETREATRRVLPKERSLSPFSKRLALTRSMNREN